MKALRWLAMVVGALLATFALTTLAEAMWLTFGGCP